MGGFVDLVAWVADTLDDPEAASGGQHRPQREEEDAVDPELGGVEMIDVAADERSSSGRSTTPNSASEGEFDSIFD